MLKCSLVAFALLMGIGLGRVRCDPATQDNTPVIRSTVREVLLDPIVRDAHGRIVTGLKPGEVTVYEDGVRQDVRSLPAGGG